MGEVQFTDRNGNVRKGLIVKEYGAFEGGMRYVIRDAETKREYRCVRKHGEFVELVV